MSTNENLRPQFWVLRSQTNTMVPLIAADELPPTITIRGVSRSLEAKDLRGMTMAGSAESRHRTYIIDMPKNNSSNCPPPLVSSPNLRDSASATPPSCNTRAISNPNIFPQLPKAYGISEQMPSHIRSPISGNQVPVSSFTAGPTLTVLPRIDRNPGPNPLPPWQDPTCVPMKAAPGVKEYCSYWLRYGECDYAQQGCLYKHEMPLDRQVLERLGHRDIPKWYREKHGLGSFLAGGSAIGEEKGAAMEGSWRRAGEAERRENDTGGGNGEGRVKRRSEKIAGSMLGRALRSGDKRAGGMWKEDWEKKGDGRFAPKGSGKIAGSESLSPTLGKFPPVKSRGPASRSLPSLINGNAHYQSVLAKKTDEACLAALEADKYAKERAMEDLKRLKGFEVLQPQRRAQVVVTPEMSSSDESADFGYGRKEDEAEWVEGDSEAQSAAISKDVETAKNMCKYAKE